MALNRVFVCALLATAIGGACSGFANERGVREQRVAERSASGVLMAIAEEALNVCPGPDATDAAASLAAAERAGWPRFIDNQEGQEDLQAIAEPLGSRDLDKISRRIVIGGESPEMRGSIELVIGQRERSTSPSGSVNAKFIGCSIRVTPRQRGRGLVTDAEWESAVRTMTKLAGTEPSYVHSNNGALGDAESTAIWWFRRNADRLDRASPEDPIEAGERRRTYRLWRQPTGLFYHISNHEVVTP